MRASCGRSDLVRLFDSADASLLDRGAGLFGYQAEAPEVRPAEAWTKTTSPKPETEPEPEEAEPPVVHQPRGPTMHPRAKFLQPVARSYAEQQTIQVVMQERPPWDEPARGDPLDVDPPAPLVPWPILWRRLRPWLSHSFESYEIDIDLLSDALGRGEPIQRLPHLHLQRFARRIRVLCDRSRRLVPFWCDQDAVADHLQRWSVLRRPPRILHEGAEPETLLRHDPWEDVKPGERTAASEPNLEALEDYRDTTVLLLGDLGAYGDESDRVYWNQATEILQHAGATTRALFPGPTWRILTNLRRSWQALAWDGSDERQGPLDDACLQARADRMLALLSPALRLEPGLVRAARSLLSPAATDSSTEADLLARPAMASPSSVAYTLHAEEAKLLRQQFLTLDRETQDRFIGLLRKWHGKLPKEILQEELFALSLHVPELFSAEERSGLRDFMVQMAAAFAPRPGEPRQSLTASSESWFRRFELRAPEAIRKDRDLNLLLMRAWAVVHEGEQQSSPPPGFDPSAFVELINETPRRFRLWQQGTRLWITDSARVQPGTDQVPVGSLLAEMMAARPWISVAAEGQSGSSRSLDGKAPWVLPLPRAEIIEVVTDREKLRLGSFAKPSWAKSAGRDRYGLFADFEVKKVMQRMRWIAPGRFLMGSPVGEVGRDTDKDHHEVELTKGYWLGETACAQELWQAVIGSNPSRFKESGEKRPVVTVSWEDCQAFLKKMNQQCDELDMRLPTEAEWEYACRAGSETAYSFGETITRKQVNFIGKSTVEVKSLPANKWGLYEMHGNVWEWCADWYGAYGKGYAVDPLGPTEGQYRVLRGGSWNIDAQSARSASRYFAQPGDRLGVSGFRLARGQ
jgi:formylglycine-generating enzyme required for sulfatase activity